MKGSDKRDKYVLLVAFLFLTFTSTSTYQHVHDQDSLEFWNFWFLGKVKIFLISEGRCPI